jgi:hypothetical protein
MLASLGLYVLLYTSIFEVKSPSVGSDAVNYDLISLNEIKLSIEVTK